MPVPYIKGSPQLFRGRYWWYTSVGNMGERFSSRTRFSIKSFLSPRCGRFQEGIKTSRGVSIGKVKRRYGVETKCLGEIPVAINKVHAQDVTASTSSSFSSYSSLWSLNLTPSKYLFDCTERLCLLGRIFKITFTNSDGFITLLSCIFTRLPVIKKHIEYPRLQLIKITHDHQLILINGNRLHKVTMDCYMELYELTDSQNQKSTAKKYIKDLKNFIGFPESTKIIINDYIRLENP